jgi:16S rRNA processing protein RimM
MDRSMVSVLQSGMQLTLQNEDGSRSAQVIAARPHRGGVILQLSGIPDRNAADAHRGYALLVRRDQLPSLPDTEYYDFEIVGSEVVTRNGDAIGVVREILFTGATDVYVIEGTGCEMLLAASRSAVLEIDRQHRRITVEPSALECNDAHDRKP